MNSGEHIDYTNYLRDKPQETDLVKIAAMKRKLFQVLKDEKVRWKDISCECYQDGCIRVSINGEYYNTFNSNTGMFFSSDERD